MAAKKKRDSARIQRRRRLDDLYISGKEVRFDGHEAKKGPFEDPPSDTEVAIWVQQANPLQREQAIREASAAKSRAVLRARKEEDSEDWANTEAYVATLTLEDLVDQIVDFESGPKQRQAIRDVLAREEWEDIQSLQDSIRQWEEAGEPEDDPEWDDLLERDREYGRQVEQRTEELKEDLKDSLYIMPRGELEDRARQKRIELIGTQAFIEAYENHMLFYSCRDVDDHEELFFESVDDLKSAHEKVRAGLSGVLADFITEVDEAKNLPRVAPGSEQLEPPEEEETSDSSTPETVNA